MTPVEASEIAAQLLVPARPRLREARDVLATHHDLDEAWDTLCSRDLVPRRRETVGFWAPKFCPECGGRGEIGHTVQTPHDSDHYVVSGCVLCKRRGLEPPIVISERPATRELALAIASDPRGVEAVYEMACEAAISLSSWEPQITAAHAAWSRLDHRPEGRLFQPFGHPPVIALSRFSPRAVRPSQSARAAVKREVSSRVFRQWIDELARLTHPFRPSGTSMSLAMAQTRAASDLEGYFWWSRAVQVGAEVTTAIASPLAGEPFASLGDPFAPLVAIWRLGYALERFVDGLIVLVAHDVPP